MVGVYEGVRIKAFSLQLRASLPKKINITRQLSQPSKNYGKHARGSKVKNCTALRNRQVDRQKDRQADRQAGRQAGRQAETEFSHPDNKIELTALGRTNTFVVFSHYTFEKSPLKGYDSLRTYAVQ